VRFVRIDEEVLAVASRIHPRFVNAKLTADRRVLSSAKSATDDPQIAVHARPGTQNHVAVYRQHVAVDSSAKHERAIQDGDVSLHGSRIVRDVDRVTGAELVLSVPAFFYLPLYVAGYDVARRMTALSACNCERGE